MALRVGSDSEVSAPIIGGVEDGVMAGDTFDGRFYDLRMWQVARTEAQINAFLAEQINEDSNDLVLYYPILEGTGRTLLDYSRAETDADIFNLEWGRNLELFDRVWSRAFKTGGWSYLDFSGESFNVLRQRNQDATLYVGLQGIFYSLDNATVDRISTENDTPIGVLIETPDYDFDSPDGYKTWLRWGLKIDRLLDDDLVFKAYGSVNRGGKWKYLGDIKIKAGKDEAHVDFRLTGSIGRFRFESDSEVDPYIITEMTMRVAGRGIEQVRNAPTG